MSTSVHGEFRVNATSLGSQGNPIIASLADSRIVAVWQSNYSAVNARLFDVNGDALSDDLVVSTPGDFAGIPQVAGLSNGGFVVSWQQYFGDSGDGLAGRIFNAEGLPESDPVRLFTGDQLDYTLVGHNEGGFSVLAQSRVQREDWLQRYDDAGNAIGNSLDVTNVGVVFNPLLLPQRDRSLLVASLDQDSTTITVQHYTGNELLELDDSFVADFSYQYEPHLELALPLSNGNYLLVWNEINYGTSQEPGFFLNVVAQTVDPQGNSIRDAFQVNTAPVPPSLAPGQVDAIEIADGQFAIIWLAERSYQSQLEGAVDGDWGVYARLYDSNAIATTDPYRVNATNFGSPRSASAVPTSDGGFLVVWEFDLSLSDVFAQRFDANGQPVGGGAVLGGRDMVDGVFAEDFADAANSLQEAPSVTVPDRDTFDDQRQIFGYIGSGDDQADFYQLSVPWSRESLVVRLDEAEQPVNLSLYTAQGDLLVELNNTGDTVGELRYTVNSDQSYFLAVTAVTDKVSAYHVTVTGTNDLLLDNAVRPVGFSPLREDDGDTIPAFSAQLFRLYLAGLTREPDSEGFEFYLDTGIQDSKSIKRIAAEVVDSLEFRSLADVDGDGSVNSDEFLNHVYRDGFGREPDAEGFNWWSNWMDGSTESQGSALFEMTLSVEFVALSSLTISQSPLWD